MEKRVILATILSAIVILLWWMWFTPSPPQPQRKIPAIKGPQEDIQIQKSLLTDKQTSTKREEETLSKDYTIETPFAIVTFNTLGAKIKKYYLKEGPEGKKLTDLILQPIDNSFELQHFATFPERNFKCVSITSNSITFSTIVDKIKFQKKYALNDNGLNLVEFKLEREGKVVEEKQFEYELTLGPGVGFDPAKRRDENRLTKVVALSKINKGRVKGILKKLKEGKYSITDYKWLALENRYYFSLILLYPPYPPLQPELQEVNISRVGSEKLFLVKLPIKTKLSADKTTQMSFEFYIGAKEYAKLKALGFEELIEFGFFAALGKLAFFSLQFFYKLTGNYGLAIIILTIIMQIILLPLTMKSYKSAKAMRVLQPKIRELQLKYKTDPKRLNAEILYLYKSQKVNPLSGCLPMILQLPIFWALFTVLNNAYELKNAPFVLWIKDLSAPDLLFTAGALPIRLLPLLMGLAMLVQQKFSGATADPSQKTFTYIMPAMFTFIFWNFPSGLVLYWLTNSILSIATQWIIMKQS